MLKSLKLRWTIVIRNIIYCPNVMEESSRGAIFGHGDRDIDREKDVPAQRSLVGADGAEETLGAVFSGPSTKPEAETQYCLFKSHFYQWLEDESSSLVGHRHRTVRIRYYGK